MKVLGVRTDSKDAILNLYDSEAVIESYTWEAGRQLSRDLLVKIDELLDRHSVKKSDLEGLVVYHGPGSFTGLRIGVVVVNTMASALNIPNVGTGGEAWMSDGVSALKHLDGPAIVVPEYGRSANITKQKK